MKFILLSSLLIASIIASFACDGVVHEILEDDGKLSWAFFIKGVQRTFWAFGAVSAALLFL